MDILYRVFYLVLSLSILMILLLPVVLLLRFLLRNRERKHSIWQWRFLFLRSICPFYITSALCLVPGLNVRFYMILDNLGMTLEDSGGLVFRVKDVVFGKITVTFGFRICSILWFSGAVLFLIYNLYGKLRLNAVLGTAKSLGENIYEVSSIHLPVQTGVFQKKWFLPPEFHTSELRWLLKHMEKRGIEPVRRVCVLLIMTLHWFNPVMWLYYFWWSRDNESNADEKAVHRGNMMLRREYAQSIMNFRYRTYTHKNASGIYEEDKISDNFGICTVYERNTEKRARKMMYQRWDTAGRRWIARCFVLAAAAIYFFMIPISHVWAGMGSRSTSGKQSASENKTSESIVIKKRKVVAGTNTTSPEGLGRVLQLEMKGGGSEGDEGYDGSFSLVMYDQMENKLSYLDMDMIFSQAIKSSYHFSKNMTLAAADYNGDGTMELLLGQRFVPTEKEFVEMTGDKKKKAEDYDVFQYSVINLETEQMRVLNQGILSVTKKPGKDEPAKTESVSLGTVDGVAGMVYTDFLDGKKYYEWDSSAENYVESKLSEEEIEAKKTGAEANTVEGQTNEHSLQDAEGDAAILVTTKTDNTSSEAIQSVIISPRNSQKKFEDIKGYYCDLLWAPSIGVDMEDQYAVLIYNGAKSQTFIVYDLKKKNVYYSHEDGTENLANVFKQFNETDITFENPGVVIYSLKEKNQDTLKIDFAAAADNNVTVKGSYEYNVVSKAAANLTFSRSIDENAETKVVPTPETE